MHGGQQCAEPAVDHARDDEELKGVGGDPEEIEKVGHRRIEAAEETDQPDASQWLELALAAPAAQHCCYSATRYFLDRGDPVGAVASGHAALAQGCSRSPELLAPLSLAEAATGAWEQAERHASGALPDPTGLAPVVLPAAALRRGDTTVLAHWSAQDPGGQAMPLRDQVDWLLGLSTD